MRSRVFQIAVVLSIVLCLTSAALWVRSYTRTHHLLISWESWLSKDLFRRRMANVAFSDGGFSVAFFEERLHLDHPQALFGDWALTKVERFRAAHEHGGFGFERASLDLQKLRRFRAEELRNVPHFAFHTSHQSTVARDYSSAGGRFPAWLLPIFFAILPGIAVARRLKRQRRIRENLCPNCGYDLRASSERCPECGSPIGAPVLNENTWTFHTRSRSRGT